MRFSSPPDKHSYNFQVWEVVKQIPAGRVATYGQIASLVPPPPGIEQKTYRAFGPRWVGSSMAACPENVPWHRVINSKGMISLRNMEGALTQRQRLEEEGITFDDKDRINLKIYGWAGPDKIMNPPSQRQLKLYE